MDWFRYALADAQGEYLFWENNQKQSSANPIYTSRSPVDWKDLLLKIERKMRDGWGVYRLFTFPMSFSRDASAILKAVWDEDLYEGYVKLIIQKRDHTTFEFKDYVQAEIDFTNFDASPDNEYVVKVNLMDKSIADFLKTIENLAYEIPLYDATSLLVNMDGIEMQNKARFTVTDGSNIANNPTGAHTWDMFLINTESLNGLDVRNAEWTNWTTAADFYANYPYRASTNKQMTIKWDVTVRFNAIPGGSYAVNKPLIQIFKADDSGSGSNTAIHTILDLAAVAPGTFLNNPYHLTGSLTIVPVIGQRIYFSSRLFPTPAGSNFINFNYEQGSYVEITYFDRVPAAPVASKRYFHVLKELVEKSSNGKYSVVSDYLTDPTVNLMSNLNNRPWDTVINSGDSQRGISFPKLKVSLNNLRSFGRMNWMLGESVEGNNLRVEPLPYFFRKDEIITTIDKVQNFRYGTAADLLYSAVKIGYDEQTYDILNGKDEFNTTHQYKMPNSRPTETLDLMSDIRADVYGMETTRLQRFQKDTTDSKEDNTLFAVEIESAQQANGWYNLLRLPGLKQGIISPETKYNFGLSPKTGFYRNFPLIYASLPRWDKGIITYLTSSKNNELRTALNLGAIIDEDANVDVNTTLFKPTWPLFKPVYFTFTCKTPEDLLELIAQYPYGVIRFKYNGEYFKGFIVSIGIKPGTKDVYEWKLLSTPDNDLRKLKTP
jgi:hypothetical protein